MDRNNRIAVIGPGAIGGTTAGMLTREGFDVTLVCKYPELASKISQEGIRIHGLGKEMMIRIPAVAAVKELEGMKVHHVVVGSCTNSSFKELMTAAAILKGKREHPETSLLISPGSRTI